MGHIEIHPIGAMQNGNKTLNFFTIRIGDYQLGSRWTLDDLRILKYKIENVESIFGEEEN
mgnify:FL=1